MMMNRVLVILVAVIAVTIFSYNLVSDTKPKGTESFPTVTVAFIADQGMNSNAEAVLQLIKAENADLVLHQGDLDYENDPPGWDAFITDVLGGNFPYLASVGNHDTLWHSPWSYQDMLQARVDRIDELTCSGDLGVESVCAFRGLFFILSGVGTRIAKDKPDHIDYIRNQLAQSTSKWRICSWHKNQNMMQVGGKRDAVGWEVFKACREGGAIVATGHEHSYSRTHLMDNFETQSIASTGNTLVIEEGRSFAFVSGLGGHSIRRQVRYDEPWWASIYTYDQNANFGALFCTFYVDNTPNRGRCYFKDIDGNIPDQFELISNINGT